MRSTKMYVASHSCHTYLLRIRFGVENGANAVVNFRPRRSHIVYIGHNLHASIEDMHELRPFAVERSTAKAALRRNI